MLALAVATGAAASTAQEPGVAPDTILIGATADLANASAAGARGAAAYFKDVNARGGVNGRAIVFRLVDDGGDPLAATQRLAEDDGAFALFGSTGAEQSLAVRDYLNRAGVPQLFVASGASSLGRDFRRFPWTIGFRPTYRAEGWIYGSYLARAKRGARVGVLYADDERGRELLAGLRQGIARSTVRIAATRIEADPATDVEALQASGADVLSLFVSVPRDAARAAAAFGWRPHVVVASDTQGGIEGAVSLAFAKDPRDPAWRDDPGLRRHRSVLARADDRFVEGMAAAYDLVRVLRAAGKEPTRAAVMAAVRKLNDTSNPFLLPGIVVRTGALDRFPVEQAQLRRSTKGRRQPFGGLWRYPGG